MLVPNAIREGRILDFEFHPPHARFSVFVFRFSFFVLPPRDRFPPLIPLATAPYHPERSEGPASDSTHRSSAAGRARTSLLLPVGADPQRESARPATRSRSFSPVLLSLGPPDPRHVSCPFLLLLTCQHPTRLRAHCVPTTVSGLILPVLRGVAEGRERSGTKGPRAPSGAIP
jgi:hypothetical protein